MSGLFGIIDNNRPAIQPYLQSVSARLSHRPWYVTSTWQSDEQPIGLGRIGINVFNREPQPIISQDGRRVLFMSGELYKTAELRQRLSLPSDEPESDPALALRAFEQYGDTFASELNGAFFIAIYDTVSQRLLLTNDRYGLYPHYYAYQPSRFVFAPEVKGVLCAPDIPRTLNRTALAEYLRFQHLLGVKTFHQGIDLFPYGSVGVYDLTTGSWTLTRYWNWDQIPDNSHIPFDEAVMEVGRRMRAAVQRLSSDQLRPGVFLSGGLDSRAIIGLMEKRDPPTVSATFGLRDSRDVYYAEQIASAVGSRHHWFDLPEDGSWVRDYLDLHFQLTEGFHSWIHLHGMSMLPTLRGVMDYNLSGWDGGTLMGNYDLVNQKYNHPVNFSSLVTASFYDFNQAFTWPGLTDAEEQSLYHPGQARDMLGRAFDSFRAELMPFWDFRHDYAHEFFYLTNHCLRMTINMITFARSHLEARFPFWDYDLVDFVFSLRPENRQEKRLYHRMFTEFMPKLANIPYDKKEFLPTSNTLRHDAHALMVRVRRRLRLYPDRPTLYADYEQYMRRSLRAWSEDLLRQPRLVELGLFDARYVQDLLERHMSGQELWTIGKISPLMTLELLMRELFD
jgi:asparagine synthase (glutamine-hydrolysing)